MAIALGIDTGGTYTDGVIVDLDTQQIITKAKAFTTRHDLSVGIRECISNLRGIDPTEIKLVSLSTTLATNATVEGRGCEVGLILIGHEPIQDLPVQHLAVIKGGHNIKGVENTQLDVEEVLAAIAGMKAKVDAFAISGYLSVRNPVNELQVRQIVQQITNCPAVCAHQLTTSLGFHERSVTACLNARLIPIIAELIEAVKFAMAENGVSAPLMIVKGDGTLISEEIAREKPIETILSGPAASIVGATFLTHAEAGIVVDMGGTTTDIAALENGIPSLSREGARVGGWLTRVQAADISTVGIGGDSYLQVDKDGFLHIGPQKVFPLSVAADRYPSVLDELKMVQRAEYYPVFSQPTDFLMFLKDPEEHHITITPEEKNIVRAIKSQPRSIYNIAREIDKDPNLLNIGHLENLGVVIRVSLTPTDILHVLGRFRQWNVEAARVGAELLAWRANQTVDEFLAQVMQKITTNIAMAVLDKLVTDEIGPVSRTDKLANMLLDQAMGERQPGEFCCSVKVKKPIIAIGAPVQAYFPEVARKLQTELLIPEHAEVANAVGAITGNVMESVEILIQPAPQGGYIVYTPWERKGFLNLDEAKEYANENGQNYARDRALKSGAGDIQVIVNSKDIRTYLSRQWGDTLYVETRIKITAMGRPKW